MAEANQQQNPPPNQQPGLPPNQQPNPPPNARPGRANQFNTLQRMANATEQVANLHIELPTVCLAPHNWANFKEGLDQCALTWGLPDWKMTLLIGSADWNELLAEGDGANREMYERAFHTANYHDDEGKRDGNVMKTAAKMKKICQLSASQILKLYNLNQIRNCLREERCGNGWFHVSKWRMALIDRC